MVNFENYFKVIIWLVDFRVSFHNFIWNFFEPLHFFLFHQAFFPTLPHQLKFHHINSPFRHTNTSLHHTNTSLHHTNTSLHHTNTSLHHTNTYVRYVKPPFHHTTHHDSLRTYSPNVSLIPFGASRACGTLWRDGCVLTKGLAVFLQY